MTEVIDQTAQPQLIDVDSIDAERDFEMMPNPEVNPEDVIDPEVLIKDGETIKELAVSMATSMESMMGVLKELRERGQISRAEAQTIRNLTVSGESMGNFFSQHPMNSFTEIGSMVNYKATCEGLLGSIINALINLVKRVLEYIKKAAKWVIQLFTGRSLQNKKSDALDKAVNDRISASNVNFKDPVHDEGEQALWDKILHQAAPFWNRLVDSHMWTSSDLGTGQCEDVLSKLEGNVNTILTGLNAEGFRVFDAPEKPTFKFTINDNKLNGTHAIHSWSDYGKLFKVFQDKWTDMAKEKKTLSREDLSMVRDFVKTRTHVEFNQSMERAVKLADKVAQGIQQAHDKYTAAKASPTEVVDDGYLKLVTSALGDLSELSIAITHYIQARNVLAGARDNMSKINATILLQLNDLKKYAK